MRRSDREIIDPKEIESIILKADVCRIALANDNYPYLVTMNFGYEGGTEKKIYFHCSGEGKKLDMIRKNSYVCFEFDINHRLYGGKTGCDFGMNYQSVVGWGKISVVTDNEEKREGLNTIMEHYSGRRDHDYNPATLEKTFVLRLVITGMTGKCC
jgi:hypothetical protein